VGVGVGVGDGVGVGVGDGVAALVVKVASMLEALCPYWSTLVTW
jgi:hypothetical protein